jgi:hypothetical protein
MMKLLSRGDPKGPDLERIHHYGCFVHFIFYLTVNTE